ncbi:hypothetical protein PRZ48_009877 [Zasmidium cellare]|uniref:Phosphatidylglycerol/phosphatidylinositol transfer protein n=1 Tax=Zasmidium cellare TaxID=395010 RepID=A0ABR0EDD0_ZASCE|nr:hypothetical protein PRZ48_009877 [Zasmidium cellare]
MKFLSIAAPVLLATSVSARSTFFGSSDVAPLDDTYAVPGDNPLKHCADPEDDILALKKVDLDPNPPSAGSTLNIVASGVLSEDVEEGAYVQLQVKFGLIRIINTKADLCDSIKNVDLECPLKKGDLKLEKSVDLPKEIPNGKYTVLADVYTKDDKKVTCLTAEVQFKKTGGSSLFKQGL